VNDDATEPFKPTHDEDPFDDSSEWDYEEERPSSGILWGRVVALAAMLILAFMIGRASAPSGVPSDELERLQNRLAASQDEVARLEAKEAQQPAATPTATPSSTPTDAGDTTDTGNDGDTRVYTVKPGDNFRDLAQKFYGDPSLDDFLANANGLSIAIPLKVGQELQIPPAP
jgi:nucleoid-associated protein YgaU